MKKGIWAIGLLLVPAMLLILGCGGEPTKQLTDAKDALEKARMAEADKYASDLFTQAENSITEAENLITQKKYGEARQLLMDAKSVAEQAVSQAEMGKEDAKTNCEDFFAHIPEVQKQLKDTQAKAKEWKIPKDKRELVGEMATWEENLKMAQAEYDAGNYYEAKELASSVYQEMKSKNDELIEMILAKQK
jgi:predicted S18 family serine protease